MSNEDVGAAIDEFVGRLEALAASPHARADLARLKRCAGRSLAVSPDAYALFYRLLPPALRGHERRESSLFLIATLFALDPKNASRGDFGSTLAAVAQARPNGSQGIDRRASVLLDADLVDLPFRLRQLVTLAAAAEIGINWRLLASDMLWWDHSEHRVQRRWARSYFGGPSGAATPPAEVHLLTIKE